MISAAHRQYFRTVFNYARYRNCGGFRLVQSTQVNERFFFSARGEQL